MLTAIIVLIFTILLIFQVLKNGIKYVPERIEGSESGVRD